MIAADGVFPALERVMLVDGFDMVLDLERSLGSRIVDARNGRSWLDMFTMFASHPLGMNHPRLTEAAFKAELGRVAVNKPSNSDMYTREMATFVDRFARHAAPAWSRHLFFVDGGALAVENALKVAFDWKVRKNMAAGKGSQGGSQVIHFREAFHGRTGYTLSLTNTDPSKTMYFPLFDWPRVSNPKMIFPCTGANLEKVRRAEAAALAEIEAVIGRHGDDIAALILEPIQGEGGDNHFRAEFMAELRRLCDAHEIFFILDEVQSGMGMTGAWWAHEHHGVEPDVIAFGKKSQICGIAVGPRVEEVEDHCFAASSRINSTWGGNLVDMVRCTRYIDIIREEKLVENAAARGRQALQGLGELSSQWPDLVSNVRGQGLFLAFDLPDPEVREQVRSLAYDNGLLVLSSGEKAVRLRPALNVSAAEIDEAMDLLGKSLKQVAATATAASS